MIELISLFVMDSLLIQKQKCIDTLKAKVDRIEIQQIQINEKFDSLFQIMQIDTSKVKFRKLKK
jgi:CII-binding regulator of phage lambda lysogenization HflD